MVDEYISREDAVNVVANTAKIVASFNYQYVIDALLALTPAADVVPVVRCKKCRNSEYDFVTQIRGCSWFRIPVTDDFFCAKGERKE